MSTKLFQSVAKVALISTALSFVVTVTMINLVSHPTGTLNTMQLSGILISLIVPILVAVPVSYNVFSQNIKLEKLVEQLRNSQRIDDLTGLLRRTYFNQDVSRIFNASDSQFKEHALFFIDLDNFKKINDVHGHQAGDNTLKMFGKVLSETIYEGDIAGRVGGEEFCLFSFDCNADEAATKAQLLINRFQQQAYRIEGKEIRATISIGICLSNGNDDLDTLMQKADRRMYMAKAKGKNQFVLNEYDQFETDLAA